MFDLLRAWVNTRQGTIVVSGFLLLLVLSVLSAFAMTGHDLGPLGGRSVAEVTLSGAFGPEGIMGPSRTHGYREYSVPPNWPLFGGMACSIVLLTTALVWKAPKE